MAAGLASRCGLIMHASWPSFCPGYACRPKVHWMIRKALFGGQIDDVWLEIGFGGGEHLAWQAAANPHVGMIGAEPFTNGVAKLLDADRGRRAYKHPHLG